MKGRGLITLQWVLFTASHWEETQQKIDKFCRCYGAHSKEIWSTARPPVAAAEKLPGSEWDIYKISKQKGTLHHWLKQVGKSTAAIM